MDNSEFILWDACYAKGLMGGALKRQLTMGMDALNFGAVIHHALEAKFSGEPLVKQIEAMTIYPEWKKLPSDGVRTKERARQVMAEYHVNYEMMDQFNPLVIDGETMVERGFRFLLGTLEYVCHTQDVADLFGATVGETVTISIYWQGKIDMIATYKGNAWIVDHKTTTVMGEKFLDTYMRSSQMLGYFWAGQQMVESNVYGMVEIFDEKKGLVPFHVGPRDFRGVLINAIALRKNSTDFVVHELPFGRTKIEEWKVDTLARFHYLIDQTVYYITSDIIVPTREHCVTKYGRCPFFDVCEAPARGREAMLFNEERYRKSDWSPLA